jgi:hypothetical protein
MATLAESRKRVDRSLPMKIGERNDLDPSLFEKSGAEIPLRSSAGGS